MATVHTFALSASWLTLLVGMLCTTACQAPTERKGDGDELRIGFAYRQAGPATGVRGFVDSYLLFESLVGVDLDGRTAPRLAAEWEWLPERRGVRLSLHSGILFHDGTRLTAPLAAQLLKRRVAEEQLFASLQSITTIEALDENTLEIRVSQPEAFLLADLSNLPLPHLELTDVGTGPYRLVRREPEASLLAFEHYYRGHPSLRSLTVRAYPNHRNSWAAMLRGELDALHEVSPQAFEFVDAETSVHTYPFLRPYYFALTFNMAHPVLGRADVRRALSQAIDREQVVRLALREQAEVAEGPIWPNHWAIGREAPAHRFDRPAARAGLDAAGLRERTDAEGRTARFRFTCLLYGDDPRYEQIALVLQKQLFELNIDMDVEVLAAGPFVDRVRSGDFEAVLFELTSGRSLAWTYLTWHSPASPEDAFLQTGYRAADAVLERLRGALTDDDTRAAVSDLQRVLFDDPPAVFIAWPRVARAVSARFGVPDEPGRDIMGSIWRWRPGREEVAAR